MKLNKLLKDLKTERVQGSSAVLNYSNFDYWVNWDDIVEIVENHKQPSLNENQQVVLEWLKKNSEWGTPTGLIYELAKRNSMAAEHIITAHDQLNKLEQFQVLAAYAECGMKEVAE